MSEEIWRTLDHFKKYEISSFGNIRNNITNCILKPNNKSVMKSWNIIKLSGLQHNGFLIIN